MGRLRRLRPISWDQVDIGPGDRSPISLDSQSSSVHTETSLVTLRNELRLIRYVASCAKWKKNEKLRKVTDILTNVIWTESFIIGVQTQLMTQKHLGMLLRYQALSASLLMAHFYSIYQENLLPVCLRRE